MLPVTFNLPHGHVVLPFPQVFPALFPLSDLSHVLLMFTSLSIYFCLRLLHRLHHSLVAVPPAGKHPSCRSPPHVSVWNSVFCQHLRGKISPSARLIRLRLQIYPNSSAAVPPPSCPSAAVFGASQAPFISASCLFCSLFHMFTMVPNSFDPSETRKTNVSNQQTCFFFFNPTKTTSQ